MNMLHLLRHAKSSWKEDVEDHERALQREHADLSRRAAWRGKNHQPYHRPPGLAPEGILATAPSSSAPSSGRTMPLCKFPEEASYSGSGNVYSAANWSCDPRFMRTFGFPSGNRRGPPSILRNGKSHSMQIVIIGLLILVVQRIFRQRLVV